MAGNSLKRLSLIHRKLYLYVVFTFISTIAGSYHGFWKVEMFIRRYLVTVLTYYIFRIFEFLGLLDKLKMMTNRSVLFPVLIMMVMIPFQVITYNSIASRILVDLVNSSSCPGYKEIQSGKIQKKSYGFSHSQNKRAGIS